ncbi:MAG TPA: hypothetical protein VGQ26_06305, partial [Streptosporangiaceae bacterium]|nr:hypothetical protein [Streptosporangiaceae bacterium]
MTEFRDIPLPGRIIIIAVAAGVFAVAGVAVATSYNAVYRLVTFLGLYSENTNKTFGVMLDVAFIVAELAAILGGILRAVHLRRLSPTLEKREVDRQARQVSRGWPLNVMLVCGVATIAFNVFHAFLIGGAHDPKTVWRCIVAAFPPVLMILAFQVLIAITKWVMLTVGRPLYGGGALSPAGAPHEWGAYGSLGTSTTPGNGHNGQALGPPMTNRAMAEMYLSGCGERLGAVTGSEVVAA